MLFWIIVRTALKSLLASKMRSFLAMLGIIIGVAAVISMLAIGAGSQKKILEQYTAMGTDLLVIRPAQRSLGGVRNSTFQTLKVPDCDQILAQVPEAEMVTPVVANWQQLKFERQNTWSNISGVAVTFFAVRNFDIDHGRAFTEVETEERTRVVVLGPVTAGKLFGEEDPLGKVIKIRGLNFRVIGVTVPKGDQGWFNPDDQAFIPYTVAMEQIFGLTYLREISIKIAKRELIAQSKPRVINALRNAHGLLDDTPDDFELRDQSEVLAKADEANRTYTVLLGSIAVISLVVGGIGIMNIMLVTVTERTREIGVRKAIGAKDRDILTQFLVESLFMSGVGGLLGVGLGVGSAVLIGVYSPFPTIVQLDSVLLSLTFSAAVGIFFGFYPAYRASLLDPIEALRYE